MPVRYTYEHFFEATPNLQKRRVSYGGINDLDSVADYDSRLIAPMFRNHLFIKLGLPNDSVGLVVGFFYPNIFF